MPRSIHLIEVDETSDEILGSLVSYQRINNPVDHNSIYMINTAASFLIPAGKWDLKVEYLVRGGKRISNLVFPDAAMFKIKTQSVPIKKSEETEEKEIILRIAQLSQEIVQLTTKLMKIQLAK